MTTPIRRIARAGAAAGVLVVFACLTGCGSGGSGGERLPKVTGRLLKNGLPLKPPDTSKLPPGDPGLQVIFYRVGDAKAGEEHRAAVNPEDGTFAVAVPPGRYRIAVIMAPQGSADLFKGKYDLEHSKIERDITGKEDVVIDIDKPTG
jgi:hypothetical protein